MLNPQPKNLWLVRIVGGTAYTNKKQHQCGGVLVYVKAHRKVDHHAGR